MDRRSKQFVIIVWCIAIFANLACSPTTHRMRASQAAMSHHDIEVGDTVLVRFANASDARSSSKSELIRITEIGDIGFSGIGEKQRLVNINYGDVFQIEYTKVGPVKSDSEALKAAGKATNTAARALARALLVVSCVALAGNGVACPSTDD